MPKSKITKENPLGLVVATKREALWMKVRDIRKENIKDKEDTLMVEREVLKLAEKIIEEEKNAH